VVGGFLIGVIEKLVGGFVSTSLIEVSSYIIIIVVMFIRPQGLFGRRLSARV
jgi:branched-chain amino acid transport system permease protein